MSIVSATSFHSLRQLRRVRHSLDTESTATLVHAFVTSRLDYCNILLAGSLKTVIDKLQRVMNAAARIVSGTRKYDRGLTQLLHAELHWLDVADPIMYIRTSSAGWYTSVFTAKRPTTCLSCACRSPKSLNDSISVQPAATCWSPQGSSWTRMVVMPLPWLCQQPGTHCRMNCETRISTVPPSVTT